MLKHLPAGDFEDLDGEMVVKVERYFQRTGGIDFREDSCLGLLLEVDLQCPDEETARYDIGFILYHR